MNMFGIIFFYPLSKVIAFDLVLAMTGFIGTLGGNQPLIFSDIDIILNF